MSEMVESDVQVMSSNEKLRRYSATRIINPDDIEKVTLPPSTELIPDEYKHEDNSKGLVFIFYSSCDGDNVRLLQSAFTDQQYNVPDENIFKITTKKFVIEILNKIASEDHSDKTCLFLVFLGNLFMSDRIMPDEEKSISIDNTVSIKDAWTPFTSDNCPSLKYKPKVILFQACPKPEVTVDDSRALRRTMITMDKPYDIPAEADILLIFKTIKDDQGRHAFVVQLCNNFHNDGHKNDIIELVTFTEHNDETRPLIISTLTRKFYLRPNEDSGHRGHRHDLHLNHDMLVNIVKDLNNRVTLIQSQNQEKLRNNCEPKRKRLSTAIGGTNTHLNHVVRDGGRKSKIDKTVRVNAKPSNSGPVKPKDKPKQDVKQKVPWKN